MKRSRLAAISAYNLGSRRAIGDNSAVAEIRGLRRLGDYVAKDRCGVGK